MTAGSLARTAFRFSNSVPNLIARYRYFIQVHIFSSPYAAMVAFCASTAGVYSSLTLQASLKDGRTGPMVTP